MSSAWGLVCWVAGLSDPLASAAFSPPIRDSLADELNRRLTADISPLLKKYCLNCHSQPEPKGGLALDKVASLADAILLDDDLKLARELLTTSEMPPKGKPQPSDHERLIIAQWLDDALDYVPPDADPDPGWFTIHRLNRDEYRNTLRDLLEISPDSGDIAAGLPQDDTGYGFDNIADVLTISPLALEQYLDTAERAIALSFGPALRFGDSPRLIEPLENTANGRAMPRGGFMLYSQGDVLANAAIPASGEYYIRISAWETSAGDENAILGILVDGREISRFPISGDEFAPQEVKIRVRLEPGRRQIAARFTNDYWVKDVADRNLAIESMSVSGPLNPATTLRPPIWNRLMEVGRGIEDDGERATAIITSFAYRAYRRPIREDEQSEFHERYTRLRLDGLSDEDAIRTLLTACLVSPNFLYRSIHQTLPESESGTHTLDGFELASRLSYFLWSSMPDEELMRLATDGTLTTDAGLRRQVRRMIADPRSDAFARNFSGQWLHLRSLDTLAIDSTRFPEYDQALTNDLVREATAYFTDILRNDKSVLLFIDGSETFVNERLAHYYGIEGVKGDDFRRVPIPSTVPRGGILTMGAILTVTSNPTRTSPVKRGLFVLEQVLGSAPPPPPADIPPLEQAALLRPDATLREQLAAHVANPTCAVCHNRLDPIGIAFEHFDAIGRWRDSESGRIIDASGTLPGGIGLNGIEDLKAILLQRSDDFVDTLAGKVLMYAIGRGLEPFDRPTVRSIASYTRQRGDRFISLIEAVVLSETFRTCRPKEAHSED